MVDAMPAGVSGLRQYSGFLYEEFDSKLVGSRGRQLIREMRDNDPVIGGMLFATKMLIRNVDWRIDPPTDDPAAQETADFAWGALNDMFVTWQDTLSEILEMLPFGFAWHEMTPKRRMGYNEDAALSSQFNDGKIGFRGFEGRAQESLLNWTFDDFGNVTEFNQLAPPDYKLRHIPRSNSLHFRTESIKNNPEGRSVLRNAWTSYYSKIHIQRSEGIGVERDLAGLPVIWAPAEIMDDTASTTQKAQYEALKKLVTSIRRDEQEGVVMPLAYGEDKNRLFDLSLLSTGGARAFDTDKIISRYDQRMAMTMLADFILLGHEAVGSKALSTDKTDLFADAIGAWCDSISAEINQRAIPKLLRWNGIPIDEPPQLTHGTIQPVNLLELSQSLQFLAQAGAPLFPNDELSKWLADQGGWPAGAEAVA